MKINYQETTRQTRIQDGKGLPHYLEGKVEITPQSGESLDEFIIRAAESLSKFGKDDFQSAFHAYFCFNENRWAGSTRSNVLSALRHYLGFNTKFNLEDHNLMTNSTKARRERIQKSRRHWLKFINYLEDKDLSINTINGILGCIRPVIGYIRTELGIEIHQAEIKPIDWYDMKYQWPDHVMDRIMQSDHPFAKYAKFQLCTTLRISDLVQVRPENIYPNGEWATVVVDMRKVNKTVQPIVPIEIADAITEGGKKLIPFTAAEYISELRDFLRDEFGDEEFDGKKVIRGKIHTVKMPIWATPRPSHMLRALGATFLARKGMTLDMIAQVYTGHRKLETLQRHYLGGYNQGSVIDKLKNIFK